MKLVVGLGNPGDEYISTRHNIGFMYLEYVSSNSFSLNKKFNAMECICDVSGEKVIFVKPLSYMNLSGDVVIKYVNYYKCLPSDLIVIQDDLDMNVGKYKIMFNHGDGGHNGIKDIINKVGTREFYRIKIGISNDKSRDTKDYVLGKFSNEEMKLINDSFGSLKEAVSDFIKLDHSSFIQKYNSRN